MILNYLNYVSYLQKLGVLTSKIVKEL